MVENIFFIGIDSGGTKCKLLISDINDKTIFKNSFGSLHYSVHGKNKISGFLHKIIITTLNEKKLDLKACGGICIGLAGARETGDKTEIAEQLTKSLGYKKITVESDSAVALHGAFKGKDGLILICGTGSILYGKLGGKFVRIGGWGRIIGDYGSGLEIGKMTLKHITEEYDKESRKSKITKIIEKKFLINKNNILKQIYHNGLDIQHLVPVVLELADKNDKNALRILNDAVEDLLNHFKIFFKKTKITKKIDVVLSGGIIEAENALSAKLRRKIKRNFKNINLVKKFHSPAEGAVLLAKNKFYKN